MRLCVPLVHERPSPELKLVAAQAQRFPALFQQLRTGRIRVGKVAGKAVEFGLAILGWNVDGMPFVRMSGSIVGQS
jgi:hypothetical protein